MDRMLSPLLGWHADGVQPYQTRHTWRCFDFLSGDLDDEYCAATETITGKCPHPTPRAPKKDLVEASPRGFNLKSCDDSVCRTQRWFRSGSSLHGHLLGSLPWETAFPNLAVELMYVDVLHCKRDVHAQTRSNRCQGQGQKFVVRSLR